jgi:hypothetical protein
MRTIGNSRQKLESEADGLPAAISGQIDLGKPWEQDERSLRRIACYRLRIELPITEGVCRVLGGEDLNDLAASLTGRQPTRE